MRVLHLCYYYGNNTSGAPVAATRLHQALLREGVESHYVCVEQREEGKNVHVLPRARLLNRLFYVWVRFFWVLSKAVTGKMLMPNLFPLVGLEKMVSRIAPDVIHVQYIGQDMLSFRQLKEISVPQVFTLHDLTIVNAIDPHPAGDPRFMTGFPPGSSTWYERWMFGRKEAFLRDHPMVFTGPSRWICQMFSRSLLGQGREVSTILNVVDPIYAYDPQLVRAQGKFTLLFGAYGGRRSPYKGWPDLVAALDHLPGDVRADMQIVVFGERAEDCEVAGIPVRFLGPLTAAEDIRSAHHAADLFALPSRQDNAPQVKFEALLDGLPVAAFQRTGCAEYLRTGENGWVAPDGDFKNYADGIVHFYRLRKAGALASLRLRIAKEAKARFSEQAIVASLRALYARVSARSSSGRAQSEAK